MFEENAEFKVAQGCSKEPDSDVATSDPVLEQMNIWDVDSIKKLAAIDDSFYSSVPPVFNVTLTVYTETPLKFNLMYRAYRTVM